MSTKPGLRPDVAEYTLRVATDAQEEAHWRAQFVPWNRGRTYEAFAEEARAAKVDGEHVADRALTTWVLVRRDDYDGEIYAGVETVRRRGLYKAGEGAAVETCFLYGVASVVTPVQHLKRGYASHMMRLLHYCLADPTHLPPFPVAWGAPPVVESADRAAIPYGVASELWSDVGSTFYERCTIGTDMPGWVLDEAQNQEIVWKVLPPGKGAEAGEPRPEWLYLSDMSTLGSALSSDIRAALAAATTPCATFDTASPSPLASIPLRCMASRPASWATPKSHEPVGIRLAPLTTDPGARPATVLFTWSQDVIGPRLLVTHVAHLEPAHLPALLAALDEVAHAAGRTEGWVWGLNKEGELARAWAGLEGRDVRGGRRVEVQGHLWAVAWYGGGEGGRGRVLDAQMWHWC